MKNKKFKIKPVRLLRAVSQILFFIFLPALYIGAFTGIKQIYLSILQHNMNWSALMPQIVEAIAVIPITILAGRFFCGWMCAFGAMEDFIAFLSRKIIKKKFMISENADRILKYLKYIWLCFLAFFVWSFGLKLFGSANPWDAFGMLLTPGQLPDLPYVATTLTPALIILVAIIAASFFVERFFCRYLCPLGAVFAILSKLRFTRIKKPRDGCGKCRICTAACPMGISLYRGDFVKSGECIQCYNCVSACPRKNVSTVIVNANIQPVVAGAVAAAAITGIYCAGSFEASALTANLAVVSSSAPSDTSSAVSSEAAVSSSAGQSAASKAAAGSVQTTQTTQSTKTTQAQSTQTAQTATAASSAPAAAAQKYKDGTYQGSGTGFRQGTTTLSVTIQNGKITNIEQASTQDTPRFFENAFPVVSQEIVSSQSTEVDAVSGATYSSNGIMQAVADALSKASA